MNIFINVIPQNASTKRNMTTIQYVIFSMCGVYLIRPAKPVNQASHRACTMEKQKHGTLL
jgi:uncharacterized membrane protein YuzA (DUF378 family)